jgi:hypothetical protein
MSASDSYLSSPSYGYGMVLAVTQASLNNAMQAYLRGLPEPEVVICYVADQHGNPVAIDYATLKAQAEGSDPFSIPDGANPATTPAIGNLARARFMAAFKARIGIPPGIPAADLPNIVQLQGDTSAVQFNLMCEEFDVVQLTPPSGYAPSSWLHQSQPSGQAWLFSSQVDMRLSPTDQSAYNTLPPAVQQQIKNLSGNPFSVEQLLFNLSRAALQSMPTLSGVAPGSVLYHCLQQDFMGAYFAAMQAQGLPMLGCMFTQGNATPASMTPTDLNFMAQPYIGTPTPALNTLNYLCSIDNATLPPPVPLRWNWFDTNTPAAADGVLAINRNVLAAYFQNQLNDYVKRNCFSSWVRVWLSGFFDQNCHWSWRLTPGQTPTVTIPPTGPSVLQFAQQSYANDSAGLGGDMGQMTLAPSFTLDVQFAGNTIVVTQHLLIYLRVQALQTSEDGNVVDKTLTDTYTLTVDPHGQLQTEMSSTLVDNSHMPTAGGFLNFFTDVNDIISDVKTWVQGFASASLGDLPTMLVEQYCFPGGASFRFLDARFSNNQDLVAHISYQA